MPHLKAIANSTPESGYLLVTALKASGACVATVAENSDDVRMMKKSDVGFSNGITGTVATTKASDFILTSADFTKVLLAIYWSRVPHIVMKRLA